MTPEEVKAALAAFVQRRKQLKIEQRVIENKWRLPSDGRMLPSGSLGAIEDGRIGVTGEFVMKLTAALDKIEAEMKRGQEVTV